VAYLRRRNALRYSPLPLPFLPSEISNLKFEISEAVAFSTVGLVLHSGPLHARSIYILDHPQPKSPDPDFLAAAQTDCVQSPFRLQPN
jgi:hypothetical protein